MSVDTEQLYNETATRWSRSEPNSLSDFTARPRVFDLCGDVKGKNIIDLGSGEGYCSREMMVRGAASVTGVELSEKMVGLAQVREEKDQLGISYRCGTVVSLPDKDASYDMALGVFVYNYLHLEETRQSFKEVFRLLKPGGEFVFSVPHPSFAFIKRELTQPFYFAVEDKGYYSGRDIQASGEIFCRDGQALAVQMIHKNVEDYFTALNLAGFKSLPTVMELGVTDEMMALDPEFFGPLQDVPLHMAFKVKKTD